MESPVPSQNEAQVALDELRRGAAAVHDDVVQLPRFFWQVAALIGPGLLWARTEELGLAGFVLVVVLLAAGAALQAVEARRRSVRSTLWSRPRSQWLFATSIALALGYGAALNVESNQHVALVSLAIFVWLATVPALLWAQFADSQA